MRKSLRQLDEDALSGALWHRALFYVPTYLLLGAVLGVVLGYFGSLAMSFALPSESTVPGPDGGPMTIPTDNSAVPIIGGALGLGLGLVAGGLLALRKRRRPR